MNSPAEAIPKFMHAFSMIVDDAIELEVGFMKEKKDEDEEVNVHAYKKVSFNGAGLGEVVKAALIAKAAQGGF
jgi:hypothetical protein